MVLTYSKRDGHVCVTRKQLESCKIYPIELTAHSTWSLLNAITTNNFCNKTDNTNDQLALTIQLSLDKYNAKHVQKTIIHVMNTWMCILITAFPRTVAPKKVQNGTRKWPHVIPARSNKGLGIWNKKRGISKYKQPQSDKSHETVK